MLFEKHVFFNNRTRPLYSNDGERWFLDKELSQEAIHKGDRSGFFPILTVIIIFLILLWYS